MSFDVLRKCLAEIKQARFFSIMADETRDCSNREQLVLCSLFAGWTGIMKSLKEL